MSAVASAPDHVASAPEHDPHAELETVYVWDRLVRATHWAIAASIVLLAATGLYLGSPFLSAPGRASSHFLVGWARVIHFYTAIAFSLAVASRFLWMFLGPRHSSWRNFVPVARRRRRDFVGTLKFYMLIRRPISRLDLSSERSKTTGRPPV
jgi:Ni/Fe-hydrogenase 1 B-type cytochrome subunit